MDKYILELELLIHRMKEETSRLPANYQTPKQLARSRSVKGREK